MKRAEKEHDPAGVLMAAKSILELADGANLTDEGEKFVNAVADEALEFAGKSSHEDEEVYGVIPAISGNPQHRTM